MDWNDLLVNGLGVAGIGAFIAAVVNLLKLVKTKDWVLIPDGTAGTVSAMLNLIAFAVLAGFKIIKPDMEFDFITKYANEWTEILNGIIFVAGQFLASTLAHKYILKGKAFIGTSRSG